MGNLPRLRAVPLCFFAAVASATAMGAYFGEAMQGTAALIACMLLFWGACAVRPSRKEAALCALLGAAFSLSRVLGLSYDTMDSYGLIMRSAGTLAIALLAFLSLAAMSACALMLLLALTRRVAAWAARDGEIDRKQRRRLFLLSAAMIVLGSVPYLILYAPGLNIFDTHDQILQFFGYPSYIGDGSALSDHHPVFLTVVYGLFMKAGVLLGSPNAAQLAYSLLSMAAVALAFAYAFVTLYDLGLGEKPLLLMAACVALYPVLALYAFNMCKDVSAAPFVLIFIAQALRIHRTRGAVMRSNRFALAVFANALMLMLTRKPSLYALAFAAVFMILAYPGVRRRMTAALLGAVVVFQVGYTSLLLPALGVIPGETREMLSVPLQQVARVLHEGREVTQEELDAVSRVLDVDYAAANYDPRLSDPVKDTTNPDMTGADLAAFMKAWLRLGLRHPAAYVEAWINQIYGYFYPSDSNTIVCLTLNSPDQGGVTLTQSPALEGARLELHNIIYYRLRRIPGIGALFYVDTIVWLFLFAQLAIGLRHGLRALAPFMFFVGTLGICLLSPKSGEIRYLMPILYALPALLGLALLPRQEGGEVRA